MSEAVADPIDWNLFLPSPPGSPKAFLPIPPGSPKAMETGTVAAAAAAASPNEVVPPPATKEAAVKWGAEPAKEGGYAEAVRNLPVWQKLKSLEGDLSLRKVSTRKTSNHCLLFAYLVSSGEMEETRQQSQCALASPIVTLSLALSSALTSSARCCRSAMSTATSLRAEVHEVMKAKRAKDKHAAWAVGMDEFRVRCGVGTHGCSACLLQRTPSLTLQEVSTLTKNMFMHESHIHALANLKDRPILIIQPDDSFVKTQLYKPGWSPQAAITRQQVKALLLGTRPPLLIHLNQDTTHFSAYVCASAESEAARPARKRHCGASSNTCILLDE
jgi:hypothetical protein